MSSATRFSKKRRDLLELLKAGTFDHPTAMEVYQYMRKIYPNISMGTVYRNLKFLSEQGEIVVIGTVGDCDRFDHNTDRHFHFVCEKCGTIIDVPVGEGFSDALNSKAFKVNSVKVLISGECANCMRSM